MKWIIGVDVCIEKERDLSVVIGGRILDSFFVSGLMILDVEFLMYSLIFGRGVFEWVLEIGWYFFFF